MKRLALHAWTLLSIPLCIFVSGCASPKESVTFVTKTSLSLVDADAAPAGISVAFDRVEGYLGPRYADGTVFPVASAVESRGKGFNREIRQIYATGEAARIVTTPKTTTTIAAPAAATAVVATPSGRTGAASSAADNKVLFFGTGTTVGLKLGFAAGTPVPESLTLGYKRKEMSVIPVDPGREPSVLGTFNNAAGADTSGASRPSANFDVEQYFATGIAATNLAGNERVREAFSKTAEKALSEVEKYRLGEAAQGRLVLDTLFCFIALGDASLDRVWNNLEDLALLKDERTVERLRAVASPQAKREIYVGDLGLLNAASPEHTAALQSHKKAVCQLKSSTKP